MTPEEKDQLRVLLFRVATESELPSKDEPQGRPAGFIPETCLQEFYKVTCTPFVELIIYREAERSGFEYLYQERHDKWWDGFCAFGGMVRSNFPAKPIEVAQKLVDREFKGMGITVATLQVVSFLKWPAHPWCNPFATVALIRVNGEIPEGGDRHWLSTNNLPEQMVVNHELYLRQCDKFLSDGALTFRPEDPDGLLF